MAGRRLEVVDVREVLRQLRIGESNRQIASRTGEKIEGRLQDTGNGHRRKDY